MNDPNEKIIEGNISPPKTRVRKKKVVEQEFINNLSAETEISSFKNNNKNNMNKTIITTAIICLILGAVIAISSYFVYVVIKMQNQVNQNTTNITQIVDFLNKGADTAAKK